jgi:hypothetical protein
VSMLDIVRSKTGDIGLQIVFFVQTTSRDERKVRFVKSNFFCELALPSLARQKTRSHLFFDLAR